MPFISPNKMIFAYRCTICLLLSVIYKFSLGITKLNSVKVFFQVSSYTKKWYLDCNIISMRAYVDQHLQQLEVVVDVIECLVQIELSATCENCIAVNTGVILA